MHKSKTMHVTGRGGLWGSEMLRIPLCLDTRLTDGGKVVSHTHRPCFSSINIICLLRVHISVTGCILIAPKCRNGKPFKYF
jgi:hypothetical protein